jgi:hypothetical protein
MCDWTDALTPEQARHAARIERTLRLDFQRWARLEAEHREAMQDDLNRALSAAPFCTGECA